MVGMESERWLIRWISFGGLKRIKGGEWRMKQVKHNHFDFDFKKIITCGGCEKIGGWYYVFWWRWVEYFGNRQNDAMKKWEGSS
jgi:hypothetical protein